jgi:hypothetical protein
MSIFNYENKKLQIPSSASEGRIHVCPAGIRGFPLPKGNRDADERKFVNINILHFYEVNPENGLTKPPQSMQKAQRSAIPVTNYEKAAQSRLRTRMTRIARIFTDPCASASSAQSVFHCNPSAFLRLIFEKSNMSYGKVCDRL